jgi:hypothetical protein
MEVQCFDIHPCKHCGKHNHHPDRCFKKNKSSRIKNHYGWMTSWRWSSIAKKISQAYRRLHSQVFMHLIVKGFASSHLVLDKGGQHHD